MVHRAVYFLSTFWLNFYEEHPEQVEIINYLKGIMLNWYSGLGYNLFNMTAINITPDKSKWL